MVKIISGIAFLLPAILLSACAETAPVDEQVAQVKVDGDKPVKTCQTDMSTGSHLQHHTECVSDDEDQEQHDAMQRALGGMSATGHGSSGH